MSELPVIDAARVSKKLLSTATDYIYQTTQMEVLAETLRDERDNARNERDIARTEVEHLKSVIADLETQMDARDYVPNISSLPEEGTA
jgi:hypothetical protein